MAIKCTAATTAVVAQGWWCRKTHFQAFTTFRTSGFNFGCQYVLQHACAVVSTTSIYLVPQSSPPQLLVLAGAAAAAAAVAAIVRRVNGKSSSTQEYYGGPKYDSYVVDWTARANNY